MTVKAWRRVALGITALSTAACNMISGADDIEFVQSVRGTSTTATSAGAGGASAATGSGETTTGVGGDPSGSATTSSTGTGTPNQLVLADGVTITEVKLYQGIERPLMKNGSSVSSDVPIVAGRQAFLRVFYSAQTATDVTLRVSFDSGEPIEKITKVSGNSSQAKLDSTVNVMLPGDRIDGSGMRIELLASSATSSGDNTSAAYPASGSVKLPVQSAGSTVKLVLVPISYGADGSNRLPDTSPEQLDRYRKMFFRLYPVPDVTVTVKPAVAWKSVVAPGGNGWDNLLNAIVDYRQKSGAKNDEYYYGIFNAAESFASFCQSGCVAGLSLLAGPNDAMARAGIGIGFSGDGSTSTAAHEIGHQHGRPHAPCGVTNGVDPSFPHKDGSIGAWGFDLVGVKLIEPTQPDFMSYCHPEWISDFNYKQLFNRIKLVNNAEWLGDTVMWDRVAIDASGRASWLEPVENTSAPSGESISIDVETDDGPLSLTGHFYSYSHVGGGVMLVPRLVPDAKTGRTPVVRGIGFDWAGARIDLPR